MGVYVVGVYLLAKFLDFKNNGCHLGCRLRQFPATVREFKLQTVGNYTDPQWTLITDRLKLHRPVL